MALYIYRVGWTYPARNPFTDLNLQKVLIVLGLQADRSDRSDPPVRPVGIFRSDTQSRPVRPLAGTGQTSLFDLCQFWSSTMRSRGEEGGAAMSSAVGRGHERVGEYVWCRSMGDGERGADSEGF